MWTEIKGGLYMCENSDIRIEMIETLVHHNNRTTGGLNDNNRME